MVGGKVFAPGCASKPDGESREEPEEHKRDSIQHNTEIPTNPQEERAPQTRNKLVAASSKAKAKPHPRVRVGTTVTRPIQERRRIYIEPSEQNLSSYDLSKKVVNLLRHNQTLREDDGAIEFYKIKFFFEIIIHKYKFGLMIVGKLVWLQEEVRKEDISIVLMIREQSSTSVLFKDILKVISLIQRLRLMW